MQELASLRNDLARAKAANRALADEVVKVKATSKAYMELNPHPEKLGRGTGGAKRLARVRSVVARDFEEPPAAMFTKVSPELAGLVMRANGELMRYGGGVAQGWRLLKNTRETDLKGSTSDRDGRYSLTLQEPMPPSVLAVREWIKREVEPWGLLVEDYSGIRNYNASHEASDRLKAAPSPSPSPLTPHPRSRIRSYTATPSASRSSSRQVTAP